MKTQTIDLEQVNKIIDLSIMKLVRLYPFFGVLALNTPKKYTESISTCATNGESIFINPEFILKITSEKSGSLDVSRVIGVICHEILHIALGHIWRQQTRDMQKWNIATDIEINSNVLKKDNISLPEGCLEMSGVEDKSAEEIYNLLPEDKQFNSFDNHSVWGKKEKKEGKGSGSGNDNQKDNQNDNQEEQQGSSGGDSRKVEKYTFQPMTEQERKVAKNESEGKVITAYEVSKNQQQGYIPAYIKRLVNDLTNPQVDWRSILAQYIQPTNDDYSFCPTDRRFSWCDIYLPDMKSDSVSDIVIGIDTSGSIDQNLLVKFISEVKGILGCYPSVKAHIGICDADLHSWLDVDNNTPVEKIIEELKGGGGTDFRPVFDKANKDFTTPSAMVFLTDTYGTFPETTPDYPVLWVIPENEKDNSQVPFGYKVYVNYQPLIEVGACEKQVS